MFAIYTMTSALIR